MKSIGQIEKREEEIEGRHELLNYLRAELIGPLGGVSEELDGESPHRRYIMGILFPIDSSADEELKDEEDEVNAVNADELAEDPVTLSGQWMPSSMGLSFFAIGQPEIEVGVWAARYLMVKETKGKWQRRSLAEESSPHKILITPGSDMRSDKLILDDNVRVVAHWRPLGNGHLITVTIVNNISKSGIEVSGEDCLCQAGFECTMRSGEIQEYPTIRVSTSDFEEQELQILYRKNKVFAVGHGCSAYWDVDETTPNKVKTQVMPVAYIAAMTHDLDESPDILHIARLADTTIEKLAIIQELKAFVSLYQNWILKIESENTDIQLRLSSAKQRIIDRLETALSRMNQGIRVLEQNDDAWKSFQLANMAMLMQMRHAKQDSGGERKVRDSFDTKKIDYMRLKYKWRPFQLAFQLLTIESIINLESEFREVVDLIWFPTGGGKTEAYLAVAAIEIFHRRIKFGVEGGGTTVITRYTLRLLTSQQFQRASRLITCCEYLRRSQSGLLGIEPISIGFWAGGSTSPNSFQDAVETITELMESVSPYEKNKFQIDCCPWCGTELLPQHGSELKEDYGFRCTNISFEIYCPTSVCPFHDRLPISVVDDELYLNPPTFLIATVDKFARMAWVAGPGNFFGKVNCRPPSLVIQDELHLLSGPLGTTVGIYECAFAGLMSFFGAKPKILASTATIRSAGSQVNSLFARDVKLFPSPGLTADDSFFAKIDKKVKGRLYLGIMSSNHRATTSEVRTAAALLQGVQEAWTMSEEEIDAYWTLVIYHLSLKELGKTVSFSRDDIPARIKVISSAVDQVRQIFDEDVLELTSNLGATEIPASLKRMEKKCNEDGSISVLACTNMFSVGVDVPRLGLMMITGQPKTTSEYIQASSRVGRGNVPGIVVTHYSASKPRDRSHYESFLAYHSSIYRYVEPSSVTPFSLPARNRALHAALVILVRHGAGLESNDDAIRFDRNDPQILKVVDILSEQAKIKDPQEYDNSIAHIERLICQWEELARKSTEKGYPMTYKGGGRQAISLLKNFGELGEGWPTLHSMRSVDPQCKIKVLGE